MPTRPPERPRAEGKFLFAGDNKLFLRGITYGTFRPSDESGEFPRPERLERDLEQMAAAGANAVRLYVVPSRDLLDAAARHGLRVLVGIPWEQHVALHDEPKRLREISLQVRDAVRSCAGHPAVLGYAIGNEIPASIVRWAGWRRIERHLARLYDAAKCADPDALVTYVNYPSTEYLELPFLDFVCFNVYLEEPRRLSRYLARLQNVAGERPLVLGEVGLDSRRHGEHGQARALDDQLRTAFSAGCAGAFVFSWTDEWHRAGHEILDWDFGLTRRDRSPKPAVPVVRRVFGETPFARERAWPRVSVVVCVKDGESTIGECLDAVERLAYPEYEVIVVDDGSTDRTAEIAAAYPFHLIRTENRGVSAARNAGLAAARGEIVAYVDADARPDPHWLHYLAEALADGDWAGVGGPNLHCPEDGDFADCVANAPGRPSHVLVSDREAEHLPGCNMAFRRSALEAVGGFDPVFRVAGDDVDLCWRIARRGWKLAFSAAAVVWHHPRATLGGFWTQQRGYGRAEALLEARWPEKYNASGQIMWRGRIYAQPMTYALASAGRVYQGTWGTAPFQPRQAEIGALDALTSAPEWYLVLAALGALALLGRAWPPLEALAPVFLLGIGLSLWRALRGAAAARFARRPSNALHALGKRATTALLILAQPAARLAGRMSNGLTPWRTRAPEPPVRPVVPWPRELRNWSGRWRDVSDRLRSVESRLRARHGVVSRGGPFDRWDLEVRKGASGRIRLRTCVEEHGGGRQFVRFRIWSWPTATDLSWPIAAGSVLLALAAAWAGAWFVSGTLAATAFLVGLRHVRQSAATMAIVIDALEAEAASDLATPATSSDDGACILGRLLEHAGGTP